jgi:hypothetical protein
MMEKPLKKEKPAQSKIEKIQKIYGQDASKADLEQTSQYLKSLGFKSLADFLEPAK